MCRSGVAVDALNPKTPKQSKKSSKSSSSTSSSRKPSKSFTAVSSENDSIINPVKSSSSTSTTSNFTATFNDSSSLSSSNISSLSNLRLHLPETPHIYDFSEICSATHNFHSVRLSSTSPAWRCTLRGRHVTVFQRRLRRVLANSARLYSLMSEICTGNHNSLVKLLGASASSDHIYLVYQFVPGANLSDCLRNPVNPDFTPLSTWTSRMQVATDLAHGLDYIHNFTRAKNSGRGFVHNRIKSSSIVISEDPPYKAKICHFGTAELCGEAVHEELATNLDDPNPNPNPNPPIRRKNSKLMKFEGVRGYMSPEFLARGVGSRKSDVYAFGVVILELLSGREPVKVTAGESGYRSESVIETARNAVGGGAGGLCGWLDRRLKDSYPMEVADKMVRLGLECVEDDPGRRPDMDRVTGRVSKMYLESKKWGDKFVLPQDISMSILVPR